MKTGAFHSSGRLDVEMLINRFRLQRFEFTAGGEEFDITDFNWELNIKQNVGARAAALTLSIANGGLRFPIYETNALEARFEAAQVNVPLIREGKMYWELVRTDTNEIWISGEMLFKYGLLDSGGSDQDVTVNLSDDTIVVNLASIVQVNGGGSSSSGGTSPILEYTTFETDGLPAGVDEGYTRIIRTVDPDYQQTINGVQYYNNKIIHWNGTRWVSWSGDYATS